MRPPARLWDDGIVDPRKTRDVLMSGLSLSAFQRSTAVHRSKTHASACSGCEGAWSMMLNKLLIANRGEIAVRVMRTAKRMGLATVAIYSDADASAMHVAEADEAVRVGPAAAAQSYLDIEAILAAAKATGADAIHPGYGFLSENPGFVEAVEAAGLTFVGPPASAIRAMGLKDAAKALMETAGVPVVPGYHGDEQGAEFLAKVADDIGYPVLIKARAGGGGKGMRKVERAADFADALAGAQREGKASFGDDRVLDREIRNRTAPHRDTGVWRQSWQRGPPVRTRLLAPAPAPEGDRGSTGTRHDRGRARGDGGSCGEGGRGHRLFRGRDGGVYR
jgi:hypothetical protein